MFAAKLFSFSIIMMLTNVKFQPQQFGGVYGKRQSLNIISEDTIAKTQNNISDFGQKNLKIVVLNNFKGTSSSSNISLGYESGRLHNESTTRPPFNDSTTLHETDRDLADSVTRTYTNETDLPAYNLTLDDDSKYSNLNFSQKKRDDGFNVTSPKDNPYSVLLVALEEDKRVGICTGTLLTAKWVLTAAHCVKNKAFHVSSVEIYAGGNSLKELMDNNFPVGSQYLKSSEYYPHPKYEYEHDCDIALVKADGKFNMTDTVNTVKLSAKPWDYYSYYKCKFTGFGLVQIGQKTDKDEVRKTHMLMVKNPCICSFMLKVVLGSKTTKRFICTKPEEDYGVCSGDSGGGLICDGEVRATAMMLIRLQDTSTCDLGMASGPRCGSKTTLSIFQDSCPFVRWVNSHVQLFNESDISDECVDSPDGAKNARLNSVFVICFIIINILLL